MGDTMTYKNWGNAAKEWKGGIRGSVGRNDEKSSNKQVHHHYWSTKREPKTVGKRFAVSITWNYFSSAFMIKKLFCSLFLKKSVHYHYYLLEYLTNAETKNADFD